MMTIAFVCLAAVCLVGALNDMAWELISSKKNEKALNRAQFLLHMDRKDK